MTGGEWPGGTGTVSSRTFNKPFMCCFYSFVLLCVVFLLFLCVFCKWFFCVLCCVHVICCFCVCLCAFKCGTLIASCIRQWFLE